MKKYVCIFVLLCFVFCSKEETQLPDTNPNIPKTWYHYLKDQYADIIENGTAINSLPLNQMEPNELFDSNFIDGIVNGKDHTFIDALEMNDLESWETK